MNTAFNKDAPVLLSLLHICSGVFPIGGFSHSFGLESMVESGWLQREDEFEVFCRQVLLPGIAQVDAAAVCLAMRAQGKKELHDLDQQVTALKPTSELRISSLKMGGALARILNDMYPKAGFDQLSSPEEQEKVGNYAVVFGVASGYLNITVDDAVVAYTFASISSFVQAAIKLVPLGQTTAQTILVGLYADIERWAAKASELSLENMGSFNPQLDIASMNHEGLYCRLYMS